MIVVDGRTDIEKLHELLTSKGERTELDFKETLNLSDKRDELDFVKDAVSLLNHYPGGYLIIGATDEGTPSDRCADIDWTQFDGQKLTDKIRKYVDAPATAISSIHEINGHTYCLICLMSLPDGLPIPFKKIGQYTDDNGKPTVIFRKGELSRRDGAGNRELSYLQWGEVLKHHDETVREEESKRINNLTERIAMALAEKGKTPPLVSGMSEEAMRSTLQECFEAEDADKIIRFAEQIGNELKDDDDAFLTLGVIGSFAAQYRAIGVFNSVADALFDYYESFDPFESEHATQKLKIATTVYEIGAAAVRSRFWTVINPLVNRPIARVSNYIYASWIRECQVAASSSNLFPERDYGMMISIALDEMRNHLGLHPDVSIHATDGEDEDSGWNHIKDQLLNSLCGFDFLYCICVFTAGKGEAGAYPACIAFKEKRVFGILRKLFGPHDSMRRELLPGFDDAQLATGTRELWKIVTNEAMQHGNWAWGLSQADIVGRFLKEKSADQQ